MVPTSDVTLHEVAVASSEAVADGVCRMTLAAPTLAPALEPGQFLNVRVPGDRSQLLRIPLAYARADARSGEIDMVFALVGDGTRRLASLSVGARTDVVGPCGHGWRVDDGCSRALLIAGGIGITPVLALARELGERGIGFDVVLGAQSASKVWGTEELTAAGAGEVVLTTDDGSAGMAGFTTDGMGELLGAADYDLVCSCGPTPMMAGVAARAAERHIPCQVSLERMMTCGFGACNTCNVAKVGGGYMSCCKDGPVFDAEEVAW